MTRRPLVPPPWSVLTVAQAHAIVARNARRARWRRRRTLLRSLGSSLFWWALLLWSIAGGSSH